MARSLESNQSTLTKIMLQCKARDYTIANPKYSQPYRLTQNKFYRSNTLVKAKIYTLDFAFKTEAGKSSGKGGMRFKRLILSLTMSNAWNFN